MAELTDDRHPRARPRALRRRREPRERPRGRPRAAELLRRTSPATARSSARRSTTDERGEPARRRRSAASLGCGVPTAVADLHEGETVLDLGSGAGADVLISARRVGPSGQRIGLDMTDEMLALARANAAEAGVENVEFLKGDIEEIPLADDSVDVVISNCVINLSADKPQVLREAARVLQARRALRRLRRHRRRPTWTPRPAPTCSSGRAASPARSRATSSSTALADAGFVDVEIRETHRVHEHAGSAIVRARKPRA